MRKKTSLIWKCSKEEFQDIVNKSNSITECLSYFNLSNKGSNSETLKERIKHDNIDATSLYKKIKLNHVKRIRKVISNNKKPISYYLLEDSNCNRTNLKRRLTEEGLLEHKCYICNVKEWNNKPLSLQLDHINGISNDNRLENLRLLCPNCHSQTDNFAGKNLKKIKATYSKDCKNCNKHFISNRESKVCCSSKCAWKLSKPKCDVKPSKEELEVLVKQKPISKIGEQFGVDGNSVRKWCKKLGIDSRIYGRGYWQKKYASILRESISRKQNESF